MGDIRALTLLAAALACHGGSAEAEPRTWSIGVENTVVSQFLWRGYVLNDSPSVQPAVNIGFGGFEASVWSNFSRTVPNGQAWTEVDFTLEYTKQVGRFALSAGILDYRYTDIAGPEENRTDEVTLGVAYDAPLSPSFKYYRDFRNGAGEYFFTGVEHQFALPWSKRLAANIGGGLGLNHHLYQTQTSISDVDLNASLDIQVGKTLITPAFTVMRGHRSLFGTHAAFGVKFSAGR